MVLVKKDVVRHILWIAKLKSKWLRLNGAVGNWCRGAKEKPHRVAGVIWGAAEDGETEESLIGAE